jgi:2-polyprenyl-6-methoxyphenol hydroxylase-like FAD-dependent oxidoreductase
MAQQPISIIGAGIGGLTLARCLLKRGIPTILYERMPSSPRHSYAITLHASSYQPLLKVLGMDEWTFKRRVAVDRLIGGSGAINGKALAHHHNLGPSSFRAHRETLERLLREGLNIQWEHALEKVEEGGDGDLILYLQNGQKLRTSCVIDVDGPHSNTRKSMSPTAGFTILPFVAFNGKRRVQRSLFDELYAPAMKNTNVIETRQKDVVLNISINGQTADMVSLSWIYSRPTRGSTDPLHKPNRPVSGATAIPEEFYHEISTLQKLEQPFKEIFNEEKLRLERVLHWLMRTILVPLPELQELGEKGFFFMGDSVHAEPIIGGQGANGAITDGVGLAECISQDGLSGIPKWYETQYPRWKQGVENSDKMIAEIHGEIMSVL